MSFSGGWDSAATLVDGRWVDRRPRRPEVADQLRRETRLLPWLAHRLPLPVPVPRVVSVDPLVVRHEYVPGEPLDKPDATHGHQLGTFLRALHDCPVASAVRHGLPSAAATAHECNEMIARFRTDVVPLLPDEQRHAALALLGTVGGLPADTVIHGDLGPEHVLVCDNTLSGVIDFGDARTGDAAIDLAWALHGAPPAFADALAAAYGVTGDQRERALTWHRLGPWHEVTHGLDIGDPGTVRNGLTGLLNRLSTRPRC